MRLGVGEGEGRTPGAAEDLPLRDAEVLAELLDIGHEVPRRVRLQARVRRALPAAALVEEDDPVLLGVEEPPHLAVRSAAGSAVEEDDRLARRVPALLEVELVQVGDAEPSGPVRLDLGVEPADGVLHKVGHANLQVHPDRCPARRRGPRRRRGRATL